MNFYATKLHQDLTQSENHATSFVHFSGKNKYEMVFQKHHTNE